tara:strand:- start:1272 stop:1622 length:351 start_codon:yes stop_codon:yes gene_type:complete
VKNKNYLSISEVSNLLKIEQHVIRFWDSKFEGISTRFGERKRRYFTQKNIKKLHIIKQLLHTDGKPHHSLEMARKIIEGRIISKKLSISKEELQNNTDINKLINISDNLKKIIREN